MEKKMARPIIKILAFILSFGVYTLQAEPLRIDVTEGQIDPMPIAILDFSATSPELAAIGQNVAQVITADLERSGLFKPLDRASFIQGQNDINASIRFADWRLINAQVLLKGSVSKSQDGRLRFEFRLYDVYTEKQMIGFAITASLDAWRRAAHKIADQVYKRVTGDDGYFDTKIVYVGRQVNKGRRVERIGIMDQDGANHEWLTNGKDLVLTPRFSPKLDTIAYLNFLNKKPHVYLMKTNTRQNQLLGQFPGMTYAPRFSGDGNQVVMSYAKLDGTSSIYLMNLHDKTVQRLTNIPQVIDTSPCFSPDNSKIVFMSDRSGVAQLYVMDLSDMEAKRISFGPGEYTTPIWSPRGDLIAFTKRHKGVFSLGVMKVDGSEERIITQGYLIDEPTWSANGRVIMYTHQERKGPSKLHTIDITGYNERVVETPHEAMGASWSLLIP
ncbi:MAG: Tol-Pal system protein TolB [Caedimonadaceae bacterium]|nr:MAG: Tol-Pal system protein TolB [Caedimonadaceae bacterium]